MDAFDLLVEMFEMIIDFSRKQEIEIGSFSFTFMEFWIWCFIASIIIAFIIKRAND